MAHAIQGVVHPRCVPRISQRRRHRVRDGRAPSRTRSPLPPGSARVSDVGDNTAGRHHLPWALAELTRLGVAMGAQPATFAGLAGMGDLIATCMSPYSRNRTVGEELGKGRRLEDILGEMHMVAEGVNTTMVALELAARHHLNLPICAMINRIIKGEIRPLEAYRGLIPAGREADPG